ncbi:MAG TPA: sugar transferase [Chloroflexota bacterium]|nr:sugar transferase [Chloroflexota bacterium]
MIVELGVTVNHVTPFPFRDGLATSDRRWYFAGKRVLDVVLSTVVLIVALPVLLIIAVLIKLDSPGPILFRQTRVGLGGQRFTFYKFRTMRPDADSEIHRRYVEALIRNQVSTTSSPLGAQTQVLKLTRDPRVTRLGRYLRRSSLDELPQLINVLRGDMSLVGPRPAIPYEVDAYQPWHVARLATLPGITGWWQVLGRSRVTFDEMVRMDLSYIAKQSLWLDVRILVMTIPAVLLSRGAV